jgi:hypothetical protein
VSVRERLEDFGEEAFGCVGGAGEIGEKCAFVVGQRGEIDHDADGVVSCAGELHGGVAPLGCLVGGGMRLHACSCAPERTGLFDSNSQHGGSVRGSVTRECICRHRPLVRATVRIRTAIEMEQFGLAGRTGLVYGLTTSSVTSLQVMGGVANERALAVKLENEPEPLG